MACGKNNSHDDNMSSFCGTHLSNDLTASAPIFSWEPSQEAMCTTYSMNSSEAMEQQALRGPQDKGMPRGICEDNTQYSLHTLKEAPLCTEWEPPHSLDQDQGTDRNILLVKDDLAPHADEQLEEYVNELVPALQMVKKSTHNNMDIAHRQEAIKVTADALLVRRATGMAWSDALSKRVCNKGHVLAHGHQGTESHDLAEIGKEDPDYITSMECASSSYIRTPVSSEGEFSDHDFSSFHHGSTASLASSDHSSMVGSTSELLQDDMDALNYVESGVSLPFIEIVSSSDAHMSSVNSSGDLPTMCKQRENQLNSDDKLHEEINARLAMIRSCCKESNEDAGLAKHSSNSALESLQVAGEERQSFHVVHHDMLCGCADVAPSNVHPGHEVACGDADVACNVVQTVHDVAFDVAPCNGAEVALDQPKQYERALGNSDEMTWQGSNMRQYRVAENDVVDEVANVGTEAEGQQGLTWQESMYVAARDDMAGDVLYRAEVGEATRKDSRRGNNNKMREMMYRVAAYQPIDWESIMEEVVGKERPRRRNVRISKEPQSVAARQRRERISDRIRILQRLVPGTSKLDTASMLDEAIHYLKFLKLQVQALSRVDKIFSLPLPLATSDCPFHLAPPYPFPSTPTPSPLIHPFPLQI